MLAPESAVREILVGNAGVSALVGQRIYKLFLKQGEPPPNIIVRPVTGRGVEDMNNVSGQFEYRISVECRADSVAGTNALGQAVYGALHGYQGSAGGQQIDRILHVSEVFVPNDDLKLFRRILDFYVYYS